MQDFNFVSSRFPSGIPQTAFAQYKNSTWMLAANLTYIHIYPISTTTIIMLQRSKLRKPPVRNPVAIFHSYTSLPCPRNALIRTARLIYNRENIPFKQKTHVILCSDRAIQKLNAMFRHKDRPTDVMSFNYDETDLLGEIYISLQRARAQAKEYRVTYANEVQRLFVHGMFHLLGYDHETVRNGKKMRKKEMIYVK
ncbi:MAG TPA: rRNA maturation RNase YbeY [Chitinivibrionales bacterium]|nr:rRNA maturation RNase YbeY [Chitinivibrionales bacterium]